MTGISINDLRKNLRDLNEHMDNECRSAAARYGIMLDASLITGIDPPPEVESALAAINTAHNQVSSRHQPGAGRRRPEDRAVAARGRDRDAARAGRGRAAQSLAADSSRRCSGPGRASLATYLRNVRLALYGKAQQIFLEAGK